MSSYLKYMICVILLAIDFVAFFYPPPFGGIPYFHTLVKFTPFVVLYLLFSSTTHPKSFNSYLNYVFEINEGMPEPRRKFLSNSKNLTFLVLVCAAAWITYVKPLFSDLFLVYEEQLVPKVLESVNSIPKEIIKEGGDSYYEALLLQISGFVIVAPIVEELTYRRIMIGSFLSSSRIPNVVLISVSSVLFILVHNAVDNFWDQTWSDWGMLFYIFLPKAILYSIVYLKLGIWYAIGFHAFENLRALLVQTDYINIFAGTEAVIGLLITLYLSYRLFRYGFRELRTYTDKKRSCDS